MSERHFEILGEEPTSISRLLAVTRALAVETTDFCVEAHFADFRTLKLFSEVIPSNRYAYYCWRPFADVHKLQDSVMKPVRNVRLAFDCGSISVEDGHSLPPYDWDGQPSNFLTVRLVRRYRKPLSNNDKQASTETMKSCSDVAASVVGRPLDAPVKTVTEWMDDCRAHHYLLTVPKESALLITCELASALGLKAGVGSFEFLGNPDQLQEIQRSGMFLLDGFPPDCLTFNAGTGGAPFALERGSFFFPILNASATQLLEASSLQDQVADHIPHSVITRKYLSWKLGNVRVSPRTQGNYVQLWKIKTNTALSVGFERFSDGDPPVSQFVSSASHLLEPFHLALKNKR